jgi:putative ABC transport system permease protein
MRLLARLTSLFRGWFHPAALDAEVAEELRFHLDHQIRENIDAGMTADEARREANLLIGSVLAVRDESRASRPGALLRQVGRDLVLGARLLRRAPALSATSCFVIGLGIGATTLVFSVVYGVMLRPLPYPQPEQLVEIWTRLGDSAVRVRMNPADHRDVRRASDVFEDIALVSGIQNFNLTGAGEPERLFAARVSSNLFSVLRVTPALGRTFTEDEDEVGNDRVVLLGDGLWKRRFGADPAIVGRPITLSGVPYRVVGVMRPDFQFPDREYQLWIPLTINPRQLTREVSGYDHLAIGRLKPGVPLERAHEQVSTIASRLASAFPATNRRVRLDVVPMREEANRPIRAALYVMLAAVGSLLLIACLNLASLLGARAASRTREFTVRLALGASAGRLAMQAFAEVVPLLVIGGALGVTAARAAVAALAPMAPAAMPPIDIDMTVLGVSIGLLSLTGLIAGALPALHAWRVSASASASNARVMTASRDQVRVRSALVVAQLALTLPLLVGSSALLRSVATLMDVDPGFRSENILTMHLAIPRSKYRNDGEIAAFYTRILERVATIPGVLSAGMVNRLPLSGNNQVMTFEFEGVPGDPVTLQSRSVTPDYFQVMSIPLREGRAFTGRDTATAPLVAVIDERLARSLWPGARAVGKRYRVSLPGQSPQWGEIVGVVGNIRHVGLDHDADRQLYFGYHQFTDGRIVLVVRGRDDVRRLLPDVLAAIRGLDPDQPVYDVRTMDDVRGRSANPRWLNMTVVSVFALSSLLLASVGLYGLVSYGGTQRVREFGVRLALGASRADVSRLVLRAGVRLVIAGAAIGLGGAVMLTMAMKTLLYGVTPLDPVVFISAASLLFAVALAASYLPARRAALTDPARVLRME